MKRQISIMLLVVMSVTLLHGCASSNGNAGPANVHDQHAWPDPANIDLLTSNGESFAVQYHLVRHMTIPSNDRFALHAYVFESDSGSWSPAKDVTLQADAAMPHHGHGMNVVPMVQQLDDGSFLVEGMLFHMPGRWELYFDITRNGVTERVQTVVFLE